MSKLFDSFKFLIVQSIDLPSAKVDLIKRQISLHTSSKSLKNSLIVKNSNDLIPISKNVLSSISHIISNNIDFIEYLTTEELMIPVVNENWITDSINKKLLASVKLYSPDPKYFFSGFFIYCNDSISTFDKKIIEVGFESFGGSVSNQLDKSITHLIINGDNMDQDDDSINLVLKYNQVSNTKIPIIKLDWITDCLKIQRKLDIKLYLIDLSANTSTIPNSSIDLNLENELERNNSNVNDHQDIDQNQLVDNEKVDDLILSDKFFYLNTDDLIISKKLLNSIRLMIVKFGGELITDPKDDRVNCFISQYRSGAQYKYAFQKNIYIGNISWIYWMILNKKWISPLKKLLHYPIPLEPLKNFKDGLVISVTNYSGNSRNYLKKLTETMGLTFTKTLKQNYNTHLLVGKPTGKKFNAAKSWGVVYLNHLWIEESFAKWELQDETNETYNVLPRDSNLSHIVGQTLLDLSCLKRYHDEMFGETEASKDEAAIMGGVVEAETKVQVNGEDDVQDGVEDNIEKVKPLEKSPEFNEKENEQLALPSSNITTPIEKQPSKKRILEEDNSNIIATAVASKKQKQISSSPAPLSKPYNITAILTGCEDFTKADLKKLTKVGIKIVEQPTKSLNCIIAPTILRTEKFLKSLSMGIDYILSPMFIFDVLGTLDTYKKITEFDTYKPVLKNYYVSDMIDFNKDLKIKSLFINDNQMDSKKCIERLIENSNNSLFGNLSINLSNKIQGGPSLIGSIVKSFGCGKVDVVDVKSKKFTRSSDGISYLLCNPDEAKLIESFKKSVSGGRFKIVEWNWIVMCIFNTQLVSGHYIIEEN